MDGYAIEGRMDYVEMRTRRFASLVSLVAVVSLVLPTGNNFERG
jgi:hypothetical protein